MNEHNVEDPFLAIFYHALEIRSAVSGGTFGFVDVGIDNDIMVMLVLQRNDGSGWDDVKTWSGSGGEDYDLEEYWYVVHGYDYRTANTIRVYNASGRLIETITTYSEIWEY